MIICYMRVICENDKLYELHGDINPPSIEFSGNDFPDNIRKAKAVGWKINTKSNQAWCPRCVRRNLTGLVKIKSSLSADEL